MAAFALTGIVKWSEIALGYFKGIQKHAGSYFAVVGSAMKWKKIVSRSVNTPSQLSYAHGLSNAKLIGETIAQSLAKSVALYPENDFFVFSEDNKRITYSKFYKEASKLGKGLLSLGLQKGDRVGMWGANCLEWVLVQYATAITGMILVNINPSYRAQELQYAINKVGCKALFMTPNSRTKNFYETLTTIIPELLLNEKSTQIRTINLPKLETVVITEGAALPGTVAFDEIVCQGSTNDEHLNMKFQEVERSLCFDEPINIQFTSGTTGKPKGATLSHHSILNNANFLCHNLDYFSPETKICIPVPLYHCFGMVLGSLAAMLSGATAVFPSRTFNAEKALKAIQEEKCTSVYGTPTMFIDMLNSKLFDDFDCSSLRTGVMAGSQCPEEVMKQVIEKMNCHEISIVYGQTEASPITNITHFNDPFEKRVSTVGRPFPFVEVKVINKTKQVVPVGDIGELCFRGHGVMKGYWKDDEKSKDSLDANGWLYSGDLGQMDESGYFRIVGRSRDMIIRGGENIYPKEIEEFLHKNPKIKDVQVIGVPNDRLGEEVCAWIRLHDNVDMSKEEVKDFCANGISYFKVPKYIKLVNEYPLTVTGKVKKYKMREMMVKELSND